MPHATSAATKPQLGFFTIDRNLKQQKIAVVDILVHNLDKPLIQSIRDALNTAVKHKTEQTALIETIKTLIDANTVDNMELLNTIFPADLYQNYDAQKVASIIANITQQRGLFTSSSKAYNTSSLKELCAVQLQHNITSDAVQLLQSNARASDAEQLLQSNARALDAEQLQTFINNAYQIFTAQILPIYKDTDNIITRNNVRATRLQNLVPKEFQMTQEVFIQQCKKINIECALAEINSGKSYKLKLDNGNSISIFRDIDGLLQCLIHPKVKNCNLIAKDNAFKKVKHLGGVVIDVTSQKGTRVVVCSAPKQGIARAWTTLQVELNDEGYKAVPDHSNHTQKQRSVSKGNIYYQTYAGKPVQAVIDDIHDNNINKEEKVFYVKLVLTHLINAIDKPYDDRKLANIGITKKHITHFDGVVGGNTSSYCFMDDHDDLMTNKRRNFYAESFLMMIEIVDKQCFKCLHDDAINPRFNPSSVFTLSSLDNIAQYFDSTSLMHMIDIDKIKTLYQDILNGSCDSLSTELFKARCKEAFAGMINDTEPEKTPQAKRSTQSHSFGCFSFA